MMALLYLILSSAVVGVLAGWSSLLLLGPASRWMNRVPAAFSSGFWFGMAAFPALIAKLAFALAFGSGLLSGTGWISDHCVQHGGHPHLCAAHIAADPPRGALFWIVAALILGRALQVGYPTWRSGARVGRRLRHSGVRRGGFQLFDGPVPTAFTAGLLHPRPYLSSAADRQLSVQEKGVILAHERHHVRRRDPLRLLLLRLCGGLFPGTGAALRNWERSAELECDRAAVGAGFSPALVARTILKMQRAHRQWDSHPAVSGHAGHGDPESLRIRITSLVCGRLDPVGPAPLLLVLLLLAGIGLCFLPETHHALETALGWLA